MTGFFAISSIVFGNHVFSLHYRWTHVLSEWLRSTTKSSTLLQNVFSATWIATSHLSGSAFTKSIWYRWQVLQLWHLEELHLCARQAVYHMQCCILQTQGICSIIPNKENGFNFWGEFEVYSLFYFECVFRWNIKHKIILETNAQAWRMAWHWRSI